MVPHHPLPVPRPGHSAAERGLPVAPGPRPPLMAGGVAPRIPPCRVLVPGCLAAPGAGRGLAGRRWVNPGGGGRFVPRPSSGARLGGPGGRGPAGSIPLPPPGRYQGGPLQRCPVPRTARARVRVPPPGFGPRGALARRRRAAGLPRLLWEWAGSWLGARGVRAKWRPSRGAAALSGGGSPLARRGGVRGRHPPGRPPTVCWLGGGVRGEGGRGGGSLLSHSGPPVLLSGGCGEVA